MPLQDSFHSESLLLIFTPLMLAGTLAMLLLRLSRGLAFMPLLLAAFGGSGWLVLAAGLLHQSTGLWLLLSAPWLLVAILSIGLAQALGRRRDDARARSIIASSFSRHCGRCQIEIPLGVDGGCPSCKAAAGSTISWPQPPHRPHSSR